MPNELADIENILKEHQAIKAYIQTISTLAEDRDINEWKNSTSLTPDQQHILNNKWHQIKQTFHYLEEGIRIHIDHEKGIFTELAGNYITKSIDLEHKEIHKQLKELNSFIATNNPHELTTSWDYLRNIISQLSLLFKEHEEKENVILNLLKKQFIAK